MRRKQGIEVLKEQKKGYLNKISAAVLKTLSTILIAAGLTGAFFAIGGGPIFLIPIFIVVLAVMVITGIDFVIKDKSYGFMVCFAASAVLLFLSASSVLRGVYMWGSNFRAVWNRVFGTFYDQFTVLGYTESDMLTAGIVFALLISAVSWELIRRKKFILITVLVLIPLCLSMVLSTELPVWVSASLLTGFMAVWCSISSAAGIRWETIVPVLFVWVLLFTVSYASSGVKWYRFSADFRENVKYTVEKLRFGEDNLPAGDLTKADMMLVSPETANRLEINADHEGTLYLRGFVGSEYDKSRWKTFSADNYGGEFTGILPWLGEENFYPGMQYSEYIDASAEDAENGKEEKVSVKNIGASRRYIYLPETASSYSGTDGKWKQDWALESSQAFGSREYSFTYYDVQKNAETQLPAAWMYQEDVSGNHMKFKENELLYRSFVYENYLGIEDDKKELINNVFFSGEARNTAVESIYTATSRIRTVLRILAAYDESPARVPANRDFLTWFLTEGKEGNSAYYATAAVFAYRAAGIPARYAEGYLLTESRTKENNGSIVLTDKDAHAWVEVYIDGMGWRAVEVTPGFYEEIYQANIIVAVPNEALTGTNGETVDIPASEEFTMPDTEDEKASDAEKPGILIPGLLLILCAALTVAIVHRLYVMYLSAAYKRMSDAEKLRFLYKKIMDMTAKLYKNFNPQQPLDIRACGEVSFDIEFYERTVVRMERMIYGDILPQPREIPAAEELAKQLRCELYRKNRFKQMFSDKFGRAVAVKG